MQVISAISPDETLHAKGDYHYSLGNNDTKIREPWTIHDDKQGNRITRIERNATIFKAQLLTEIHVSQAKLTRIEIRWKNDNDNIVAEASATYKFSENELNIIRQCDGQTYSASHKLTNDIVVSPLMRIGIGYVLTKLVKYPNGTSVLIPNIKEPANPETLLAAYFENRKAKELSTEPVMAGGINYQARRYQYIGELYTEDANFWLDKHDILLRYTWKQSDGMRWNVELHDYSRG